MKRLKSLLFAAAAAVALAGGSAARADISWEANWTPGALALTVGPSSVINFTNLANGGYVTLSGATMPITTPITNTSVITTATPTSPDSFTNKMYALNLVLTDSLSGLTHTFNFSGALSGSVSTGGGTVSNVFGAGTTQTFTFADGDSYKVVLNGYLPPGSGKNITTQGGFSADVYATGPGNSGNPHGTPEPSTMALGGLGMFFTGLMAWRRRNRTAAIVG
jgi:hypothetical protein